MSVSETATLYITLMLTQLNNYKKIFCLKYANKLGNTSYRQEFWQISVVVSQQVTIG